MIALGIDPGQQGGIALIEDEEVIDAMPMPLVEIRNKVTLDWDTVEQWILDQDIDVAEVGVIENVWAMPKQGVSSTFQFGRLFGAAEMVLYRYSLRQVYATGKQWKGHFNLDGTKEDSMSTADYVFGEAAGEDFWPRKKDDGVAEAALLARYGIETYGTSKR